MVVERNRQVIQQETIQINNYKFEKYNALRQYTYTI